MFPSSFGRNLSRPPPTPVAEFGDKFRKAREAKGISLDDASNVTKIGARMLQAIEEEHFDLLPGGVFNKGFIRAYAKHLGLDAEEAVTDYLACLRQAQVDAHEVWEPVRPAATRPVPSAQRPFLATNKPAMKTPTPAPTPTQTELPDLQLPRAEDVRRPRRDFAGWRDSGVPWRIVAVAAVVIILGTILWILHSRTARTATASANPSSANPSPAPSASMMQPAPAPPPSTAQPATSPAPVPTVAGTSQPSSRKPATNAAPNVPSSKPNSQPSSSAQPLTQPTSHAPATAPTDAHKNANHNADNKNNAADLTLNSTSKIQPAPPAAPMTLVIRASETTWISVIADGQPITQETLIAPAHTSIRATRDIVLKVGNAAGVTFLWNGQDVPAQGAEAEVKTFIFDSTGMRVSSTSQPPQ